MNRRTRIVAWLRVILPLAALAILSTLFLVSRRPDPDAAIPYARVDAEARARDPRVTAPSWSGVTPDGATLALSADSAVPAGDEIGAARNLRLDWQARDGLAATVRAAQADLGDDAITLSGGVAVSTSSGWQLAAPKLEAATDASRLSASGGVTARAPFGAVSAQSLSLRREGADHVLDFTGAVRLVYRP